MDELIIYLKQKAHDAYVEMCGAIDTIDETFTPLAYANGKMDAFYEVLHYLEDANSDEL